MADPPLTVLLGCDAALPRSGWRLPAMLQQRVDAAGRMGGHGRAGKSHGVGTRECRLGFTPMCHRYELHQNRDHPQLERQLKSLRELCREAQDVVHCGILAELTQVARQNPEGSAGAVGHVYGAHEGGSQRRPGRSATRTPRQ